MVITIERVLLGMIPVLCGFFASRSLLHYFQLESYQFPGFFRTIRRNRAHALLPGLCAAVVCVGLFYAFDKLVLPCQSDALALTMGALLAALSAVCGLIISRAFSVRNAKKKLVYTGRVKRLLAVYLIVLAAVSLVLACLPLAILPAITPLLLPLWLALAGLLAWPIEKLISELYFRDARRKLLSVQGLRRIGITGSYGKTTVKHILGTILSEKYPTLVTPASFNTPMGVSRAIREKLTPSYQVFVGEMGARHVGDIKEMCRLVRPTIGVLTSVGPQHLDTFRTMDRIIGTKYELIEALPDDSMSFFPNDNGVCLDLYRKTQKPKTLVSVEKTDEADCWSENVCASASGSSFELCFRGEAPIACQTRLLGKHNIQNILLGAAVAKHIGLSGKQIAHGISKLEPVKSRLELMSRPGAFTIINDAFNSNPVGAKAALDVFRQFPARRIIITPGMVELGEKEAEYNRAFGRQMASCVDVAIIVGKKRAQPIIDGLLSEGFPQEQIHRVDSLDDSTKLLNEMVTPSDTVLYENDLPDNYQEA